MKTADDAGPGAFRRAFKAKAVKGSPAPTCPIAANIAARLPAAVPTALEASRGIAHATRRVLYRTDLPPKRRSGESNCMRLTTGA